VRAGDWWRRRGGVQEGAQAPEPDEAWILEYGDGWSRAVAESVPFEQDRGLPLRRLLALSGGARPTHERNWTAAIDLLAGTDRATTPALRGLLGALATARPHAGPADDADGRPVLVGRENTAAAVNTVWAAAHLLGKSAVPDLGAALRRLLEEPWSADSTRLRNACAGALADIAGEEAIDELRAALAYAQSKGQRELLLLCMGRASGESAKTSSRLAELAVATHGLDVSGRREITAHHRDYLLTLHQDGSVTGTAVDAQAVDNEAADRVLRGELRAIKATYRKEVERIEALLATDRTWTFEQWQRLYLENPITRAVASRLVWRLQTAAGATTDVIPAWAREHGRDRAGDRQGGAVRAVDALPGAAPWPHGVVHVTLWHPREATHASLAEWRSALRLLPFRQPFQQIERQFTEIQRDPDKTELEEQAGAVVDAAGWEAALARLPWSVHRRAGGKTADSGDFLHRDFPDEKITATAMFTKLRAQTGEPEAIRLGTAWIHRTDDKGMTPLPLEALPPRISSEAQRDLTVLMAGQADNTMRAQEISDTLP
jgi:hypothetical protein